MAVDLPEEVRKKQAEDSLSGDDPDPDSEAQDAADDAATKEADTTEQTDTSEQSDTTEQKPEEETEPAAADGGKEPYNPNGGSLADYTSVPAPTPTPTPAPKFEPEYAGVSPTPTPTPTPEPEYAGIQESPEAPDKLTQVERAELVKLPPGQPAPDKLDQVERAELVKLPVEAPGKLTQVERGELVGQPAPDKLTQVKPPAPAPPIAPGPVSAAPPQPIAPGPIKPAPAVPLAQGGYNPNGGSLSDYMAPANVQPAQPAQPPVGTTAPAQPQAPKEPRLDAQSTGYEKGRNGYQPQFIILHSTDGRSTQSDLNTFTDPNGKVGVHYLIGRDGKVYHLANENDAAKQAGYDKYGNYANDWTIGIEQSHVDRNDKKGVKGEEWTDADIRSAAKTTADIMRRNPQITLDHVLFHSDLAGERKQDPVDYPMQKFYGYVQDELGVPHTPVQKVDYYKPQPVQPAQAAQPTQPAQSAQAQPQGGNLADAAQANVGVLSTRNMPGTEGGNLGCAGGVCKILNDQGYQLSPTLSTSGLYDELKSAGWREVDPHTPGAVIVSPTVGGTHGHTGIVGQNGLIYSNSSATGNWEQNYTVDGWQQRFHNKGLETHAFLPPGPEAPGAQAKGGQGFYPDENPNTFVRGRATTFATPDDIASGQDTGVGAPHLGRIDTTQVAGIAVPEEALQAQFGNNYAAWRQARVDVIDPTTGKRLRLPIVDLGPGTGDENTVADMTPWVSKYFGGDKNLAFKLVPNAGPDVQKNPQTWADEQAAIKEGFDSGSVGRKAAQPAWSAQSRGVPSVNPAQNVAAWQADAYNQANMRQSLVDLGEQYKDDPVGLFKRLDQPVQGVSRPMQQQYQGAIKTELTKFAQDHYGIKDPDEAFKRITSDPNVLDYAAQAAKDVYGGFAGMVANFNANLASKDEDNVHKMLALVHPNATTEQISTAMKALTNPDLSHHDRERLIRDEIMVPYSQLDQAHQSTFDLAAGVESLRNLSNPQYVADQKKTIDAQISAVDNLIRPDPRLNPTAAHVIGVVGQLPAMGVQLAMGPIGGSLLLSDIYKGSLDKLKAEHPEMSDAQRQDLAGRNALVQAGIMYGTAGMGQLFEGTIGDIENSLARGAARAGIHAGAGGLTMITAKAAENLITAQPVTAGLGEAAITGAGLGVAGGLMHGEPAENVPRGNIQQPETRLPTERPGVEQPAQVRQPESVQPSVAPEVAQEPSAQPGVLAEGTNVPTQEDVARRAYEISQDRVRTGQAGDMLSDWTQAQRELSQGTEPSPVTQGEGEPWVSSIANRFTAERMASGELGEVVPGEGASTEALLARGMRMGPEEINQHVSDLINNKGNIVDQAAAIRAEEARLSQRANAASRAVTADPGNQQLRLDEDNAAKDLTDFHNGPVAKLKNDWHKTGMGLQGEIPVDLSTFNGLREAFLKENGKSPDPKSEPAMRAMAKKVSDAAVADKNAMLALSNEIKKQSAGRKLPSADEVRDRIREQIGIGPCPT
jgi:N-acetyl-anhydromuramyl-L-alanine amidase AmpD